MNSRTSTHHSLILIVLLVITAGCNTVPSENDVSTPGETTTQVLDVPQKTPTQSTTNSQEISIVNNRSTDYLVSVQVINGPVSEVNFTLSNGTVLTRPIDSTFEYIYGGAHNVTEIQPTNSTPVARWSAYLVADSTVTLPVPVERTNVTVMTVVSSTKSGTPVVAVSTTQCPPSKSSSESQSTLREVQVELSENSGSITGGGSCG